MNFPYRLEPIVDLISGNAIGHELLAGDVCCPDWNVDQWQDWYAFLAREVPRILSAQEGGLFINIDGEQILDEQIHERLRLLHMHASRIVFEWTEYRFHSDQLVDVLKRLSALKNLGFSIAIDDIGADAGVDGLGRAGAIKSGFCKIDGPYFQRIRHKGPEYLRDLCRHLAHGGARVIVEWVETEEDYRLALAAGAHLGQGHFWSRQ